MKISKLVEKFANRVLDRVETWSILKVWCVVLLLALISWGAVIVSLCYSF